MMRGLISRLLSQSKEARRWITSGSNVLRAAEAPAEVATKTKKRRVKRPKYGLGEKTSRELDRIYKSRQDMEDMISHPTLFNLISDDAFEKGEEPNKDPPGTGPILRWQTCVVFPSDGSSWHPLNRKVKVSVYVRHFGLSKAQKRRLLDLVGNRYKKEKDELTITSSRFEEREENRKDVVRILYALLEEAMKAPDDVTKEEETTTETSVTV